MTNDFFSLKRLRENLSLFDRLLQARGERKEGNCGRCGISLKGIPKEETSAFDGESSYYVCIPCKDRIRKIRIYIVVAGIVVMAVVPFVHRWLDSR